MRTCQCSVAISMLGDGCRYCQPQTYIEHLLETLEDERAAPVSEAKAQGDAWAPSVNDYDRSIHSNPDAKEWADFFVATFPGLADKHDLMIGWFANAMMAMHDHLARKAQGVVMPERKEFPELMMAEYHEVRGWNACLNEVARLNAAPVQQPKCKTCDDNGRIGGPSFCAPDEGGEPCPDCCSPVQQVSVPDGWKLAPVEPTYEMLGAALMNQVECLDAIEVIRTDYKAMLAAAPVQQVSVPDGLELIKRMQVCLSLDDTEWGLSAPEKYKLLGDIKSYVLASPAAPAADAGLVAVEWEKDAEEWGPALNGAGWLFLSELNEDPQKSALIFNNTKGPLRAAIMKYAEIVAANAKDSSHD